MRRTLSVRQRTILTLFALGEAAVLAPIVLFCVPLPILDRPGVIILVALLLGVLAAVWRWLGDHDIPPRTQVLALGAIMAALTIIAEVQLASVHPEFELVLIWLAPGFAVALLLLWRGASLGQTDLTFTDASRRLQMGALALVVMGMGAVALPRNRLIDSIVPFFVSALFAMPLAHLESVSHSVHGRTVPMTGMWWLWSGLITALAALASGLILSFITGTPIVLVLIGLLALLALPIILLLSLLLPNGFNGNLGGLNLRLPTLLQLPETGRQASIFDQFVIPPQVNFLIAIVVLAVVGGTVLVLLGVAQRSKQDTQPSRPQDDFDIAQSEAAPDAFARLRTTLDLRRWLAALSVRRLYARMLHEAEKRGPRRLPAQTPLDYLPQLRSVFPHAEDEVSAITRAYVAAHYGELPDDEAALARLRAAWDRARGGPPR